MCLSYIHSKGSVICKLTLLFAADPLNTNDELLADLLAQVSTGKVGLFTVDKSHPVNVEPDIGEITLTLEPAEFILFGLY